jgi:hypothetical protein
MFFHFLVPTDKLRTTDVGSGQEAVGIVVNVNWRGLWGGNTNGPSSLPTVDLTAGSIVHTHSVKSLIDLHRTKGTGDLPRREASTFILLMLLKVMQM